MTTERILTPDEILPPDGAAPPPRRRRRRPSRRRRLRRRLLSLSVLALGAYATLVGGRWAPDVTVPTAIRELRDVHLAAPPVVPVAARKARTMYRYSVVPGGVFSRTELEVAVNTDPVVALHYGDFDVANAHLTRVETPRAVHVSYRLGDRVYWTRGKVWLRAGEALLSDGVELARGRCGNRVADIIAGPVAPEEPPIEVLDQPVVPPPPGIAPLVGFDLMFAAVPEVRSAPLPLDVPVPSEPIPLVPIQPPLIIERTPEPPPPPSGPVPEPGTLALLGTGVSWLLARRWRRGASQ